VKVCIVGHGPSAKDKAAEIDACDYVVRMCGWFKTGQENTGTKLNAYAWFGTWEHIPPEEYAKAFFCHWFTLPLSRCCPPHEGHGGHWDIVVANSVLRPIRHVPEYLWQHEAAALHMEQRCKRDEVPPSTGFTAIDMALRILPVTELVLYGFDATTQDRPGWGDNNPQWRDDGPHDLAAEKRLIARLADNGEWLGEKFGVKVVWPDRPEGV
jgi:hypothetical protein